MAFANEMFRQINQLTMALIAHKYGCTTANKTNAKFKPNHNCAQSKHQMQCN